MLEVAIVIGIIVTVLGLLAYEDAVWKEGIRRRNEERERKEAEEKRKKELAKFRKEDPLGALFCDVILAGLCDGLKEYAESGAKKA